ncbi:MAG: ribonuclease HI [bacterium]|nr:ribonuclease HI [bacterium]
MVEIWTDGSSINYKGKWFGGSGAILKYKDTTKCLAETLPDFTNNMAEIYAMILGLKGLNRRCEVTIFTDSAYSLQCVTSWIPKWVKNDWKTSKGSPVKNKELITQLYDLCQTHKVKFVKVKAHSGIDLNEKVDKLAYKAALKGKESYIESDAKYKFS